MVPAVHSTVWPDVIEVDGLIIMSVPEVPTVRPVTISVPELFLNRAIAAVPVLPAVAVLVKPENDKTSLLIVPHGSLQVNVASTDEYPDVHISSVPAPVPESISSLTAVILVVFNDVL
jgi:hypothetical protein